MSDLPPLGPVPDLRATPAEALRDHDRLSRRRASSPSMWAAWPRAIGDPLAVARSWGCEEGYESAWIVAFFETNNTMEVLL
jgi:hypothetical protein